jgi:flagellar hook protein FlgE
MSLLGVLDSAVSGMSAQSQKLTNVGTNISNSDTVGYKETLTQFETLLGGAEPSGAVPGGTMVKSKNMITGQGTLASTGSATDLAVKGNGFFVVADSAGANVLTRSGSFVHNAAGNLVNTAGFTLMGYSLATGTGTSIINSLSGLTAINIGQGPLTATATTTATLSANLPSAATAVATALLPSANLATSSYTDKSSIVAYDNLGSPVTLDVYTTKTAANTWEIDVYNQADAASGGGFPYSSSALNTTTLNFSSTTGALTSPSSISLTVPNGQTMTMTISSMTQLAASYTPITAVTNGNAPSTFDHVSISSDGILSSVYSNGTTVASYKIPLATVPSPDFMTPLSGNVYEPSLASGTVLVGTAGTAGLGTIASATLEQSTVDLANELTNMIVAQHAYQSNAKVFQTGTDMLDILMTLKQQ